MTHLGNQGTTAQVLPSFIQTTALGATQKLSQQMEEISLSPLLPIILPLKYIKIVFKKLGHLAGIIQLELGKKGVVFSPHLTPKIQEGQGLTQTEQRTAQTS